MFDRAARGFEPIIKNEVVFRAKFAVFVEEETRNVEVEVFADVDARVPAQADAQFRRAESEGRFRSLNK